MKTLVSRLLNGEYPVSQAFSLVLSSRPRRNQSKGSMIPIKAVTPYYTVLMGSRCCDRS